MCRRRIREQRPAEAKSIGGASAKGALAMLRNKLPEPVGRYQAE
jgi:hypothetical protein